MGTGGWGSSAFSSPLGMALLADWQLLGCPETVQLYYTMQQSDSSLLLCQINIEVSGAPHCGSTSACCMEGGKGRAAWELPLSSFILTKLALDSQDIKDYWWDGGKLG
uniref:Uncharacterized protein n=1 Tax=Sphaeramia orbicularis TaxID=375764 RepID=A0A673C5M9_9TELE